MNQTDFTAAESIASESPLKGARLVGCAGLGKAVEKEYYQDAVLINLKYLRPVKSPSADSTSQPQTNPKAKSKKPGFNVMNQIYEGTLSRWVDHLGVAVSQ